MTEKTQALRLAAREFDGFERALATQIDDFGEPVEVAFLEVQAMQHAMVEGDLLTSGEYDVAMVLTDSLPRLLRENKLLPLDEMLSDAPPDGYPGCWVDALTALQRGEDGRLYGTPYHDGPEMLLYRADLFASSAEQEGFLGAYGYPLAPARTWREFRDQARWFTRPDQGMWGTILAGYPDEHNTVYDFLIHLWSRGGELFGPDGSPQLTGSAAVDAMTFISDLWHVDRVVNPDARTWASVQSGEHFAAGEAALMVNWCGFTAMSAGESSPTHGLVGCTLTPSGDLPDGRAVTMNGYYVMAIPVGCRDVPGAMRFLRHLASPAMDVVTCMSGGSGTRTDTWARPDVQALAPYYAQLEGAHAFSRALPRDPRWPEISRILNRMMADVIGGTGVMDALRGAQAALEALPKVAS